MLFKGKQQNLFILILIFGLFIFGLYKYINKSSSKISKQDIENYYYQQYNEDDEDLFANLSEENAVENVYQNRYNKDDEDLFANLSEENTVENVQPTLEQRSQMQIQKNILRKQLANQKLNTESKTKCNGRCDCCYQDKQSIDRMNACSSKYKKDSKELIECLNVNSKYSYEACKDKFGTGGFLGIGKKCL